MSDLVVADSSALICYQRIQRLDLLRTLYETVVIPQAVADEVFGELLIPEWIEKRPLQGTIASQIVRASLGKGESEAIALALELRASLLILDDLPARRLALGLGIEVVGSLGTLVRAKRRRIIKSVRPLLQEMQRAGFHVSDELFEEILQSANEI